MAEEEKKKSFWETLPGIITAIAALITAIAALIAAMNGGSKEGAAKPDAPSAVSATPQSSVPSANDEAAELKRKLSEIAAAKAKAEAEAAAAKARAEEAERHAAELERKKAEPSPVVQPKPTESVAPSVHSNADQQKGRKIGQYIDHGDGTITDEKRGLMWKRCAEGLSGMNCEKGKTETYKWDDAVKRSENIEYAGYKDWRMPSIDELRTLVKCSKGKDKDGSCNDGSEKPTINQQAFPNTETWFVCSGSPYAVCSDDAWVVWVVNFSNGYSSYGNRDINYAVRLVRGGQ